MTVGGGEQVRKGRTMKKLCQMFRGPCGPRGLSRTATIVIAVIIVLVCGRFIMALVQGLVNLLRLAIEIGVLNIAVLLVAWLIQTIFKKVE